MTEERKACTHRENHHADIRIACMEDSGAFLAEIRIHCKDCGLPFQFLNLPLGLHMQGAAMSADGQEARLAIVPVGSTPHPLAGVTGFGVSRS